MSIPLASLDAMDQHGLPHHPDPQTAHPDNSIIELAFAGNALAKYFGVTSHGLTDCICGVISPEPTNPENHTAFCPVARVYAAIEAVRKAAL